MAASATCVGCGKFLRVEDDENVKSQWLFVNEYLAVGVCVECPDERENWCDHVRIAEEVQRHEMKTGGESNG